MQKSALFAIVQKLIHTLTNPLLSNHKKVLRVKNGKLMKRAISDGIMIFSLTAT